MSTARYALVAYVRDAVGEFVNDLRRELHPNLPHLAAHLTILPPRPLPGSELSAREFLEDVCSRVEPFTVQLGEVETFCPQTPTVFIRVERDARRMCELHDRLKKTLAGEEEWPYMPHLTIVKLTTHEDAQNAYEVARERWKRFSGSRTIPVDELTFVRETEDNCWEDLAEVPLGRSLVSPQSY
ncbi:MAG TPA: 2'-5' RNA ligase family protein [Terriglobales bacterium]|nr:2'-5' RNA ligase family protein [Terriglobales bacterium]